MTDSGDEPSVRPTGDPSDLSLGAKLVGGLQWAITGAYVFLLGFLAVTWYLHLTRTPVSMDFSGAFAVFAVAAFAAGFLWVESNPPDRSAHERRVEVVVTLLVLGFLFPFGMPTVLDRLSIAPEIPLFGFGVAYTLTLTLSYWLVYGLGMRFFLGPERPELQE